MKSFVIYLSVLCTVLGLLSFASARTPNFVDGKESSIPQPMTEEEYLEYNQQQRYGACYPYCKEANQLWVDHIWRLMNEIDMLKAALARQRIRLEMCEQNISLPPIKCEPCIQIVPPGSTTSPSP